MGSSIVEACMYVYIYIYIYVYIYIDIYGCFFLKPIPGRAMFQRGVSAVFRGSVSGQVWKCFGTVFQQFRQHIWEDVSGMCFGAVFGDAETRPRNVPLAQNRLRCPESIWNATWNAPISEPRRFLFPGIWNASWNAPSRTAETRAQTHAETRHLKQIQRILKHELWITLKRFLKQCLKRMGPLCVCVCVSNQL